MTKRERKKLRHMRKIVVDGERWRWCAMNAGGGGYSEYTPGFPVLMLYLRDSGGRLTAHRGEDIGDDLVLTPCVIADYIRKVHAA